MRDDFVGNGGELGLAGVESEPKGAVGVEPTAVPTPALTQGALSPRALKPPTESRLLKVCKNPLKPPDLVDELG